MNSAELEQKLRYIDGHLCEGFQMYSKLMQKRGHETGEAAPDPLGILCLYVDAEFDMRCCGRGSPEMWAKMLIGMAEVSPEFRKALAATYSHYEEKKRLRDGPD